MAIERLVIPDGLPIWGPTNPLKLADRALAERTADVEELEPGEYDLTPTVAQNIGPHSQQLIVFDNGTGLYRVLTPEHGNLTSYNFNGYGSEQEFASGSGTSVHLPQDHRQINVVSYHAEKGLRGIPHLFNIVRWVSLAGEDDSAIPSAAVIAPPRQGVNMDSLLISLKLTSP